MPNTSSLGDLTSSTIPTRHASRSTVVAISGGDVSPLSGPSRYERLVSVCACLLLVACGMGIGIWASM